MILENELMTNFPELDDWLELVPEGESIGVPDPEGARLYALEYAREMMKDPCKHVIFHDKKKKETNNEHD